MDIGFIYILQSPAMADLYKIGFTMKSPHARAGEISAGTGIPIPFDVVMYWEVDQPRSAESEIHEYLSEYRVSQSREFFRCDLEFIIDTFRMHAFPYAEYNNPDYIASVPSLAQPTIQEADNGSRKKH